MTPFDPDWHVCRHRFKRFAHFRKCLVAAQRFSELLQGQSAEIGDTFFDRLPCHRTSKNMVFHFRLKMSKFIDAADWFIPRRDIAPPWPQRLHFIQTRSLKFMLRLELPNQGLPTGLRGSSSSTKWPRLHLYTDATALSIRARPD